MTNRKYNQFAGVNALSHNAQSLSQAVKMEQVHARKELIFEKTGWFKDADRRWKFEIDDHDATLIDGWREQAKANKTIPLNHVISHNEMFHNYPELKELSISVVNNDEGYWGEFDEKNGLINISETVHDDSILNVICHETNHAIQAIEKFGMGGTNTFEGKSAIVKYLDALINQSHGSRSIHNTERDAYHASLNAETSRERITDIAIARDAHRLVNYAHSSSPSGVFRHVRNALTWVDSDRFKDENDMLSIEAREVIDDYMNIPKSNRKGARNDAIADVCIKASQLLRRSVNQVKLNEIVNSDRDYTSLIKIEERKLDRFKRDAAPFYELEREIERLIETKSDAKSMTGYEIYQALNGEETSRATEKRLSMSKEQRMERPPWLDMKPHDQQLSVLYKDGYMFRGGNSLSAIEQVNKASIEFGSEHFAKMLLHPLSDASSVMHETAHYFLEIMSDLNVRDGVAKELRSDFNDVLDFLNITEIEWYSMSNNEKEPYHEKFAEGFEDYLLNGETTNPAITSVFEKLKGWISAIYEKLGANKLSSSNGGEHIYERLLSGNTINMSDHKDIFSAIGENISVDVKEATDAVYSASMGYFSKVSGLQPEELTHRYNLVVEHDNANPKDNTKSELINDSDLENMTQADYENTLRAGGFDVENTYYHGTAANFDQFDESYFNKNEPAGDYLGAAFYFTTNKNKAIRYAHQAGGDIVKQVFLRQENPLIIPKNGVVDKSIYDNIDPSKFFDKNELTLLGDNAKYYAAFEMTAHDTADYIKSKGYDGLMDHDYGQVAVFSASNIVPSSVDELKAQRGISIENGKIKSEQHRNKMNNF